MAATLGTAGAAGYGGASASPVTPSAAEAAQASSPQMGDDRLAKYLLELWGKCQQSEDATVTRAELQRTLCEVVGAEGQAQVMTQLCMGKHDGEGAPDAFDFLSYWQGMDRFFATKQQRWPHEGDRSDSADTVRGLQRLRDGLLDHWRKQGAFGLGDGVSPATLLAMLADIKAGAKDQQYWQFNMEAIADLEGDGEGVQPCDLAEAIHCWLSEIVHGSGGVEGEAGAAVEERDALDAAGSAQPITPALTSDTQATSLTVPLARGVDSRSPSPLPLFGSQASCKTPVSSGGDLRRLSVASFSYRPSGRRASTASDAGDLSVLKDLHHAYDVIENLRNLTDTRNTKAHRALEELLKLHGSVGKLLHVQDSEICKLRESAQAQRRKRESLEAELMRAAEIAEKSNEVFAEADEQRRRADALEIELLDLKERFAESCQELEHLKATSEDVERERAEIKRREMEWGSLYQQLEQETERTDGQRQWMQAELSRQGSQLVTAEDLVRQLRRESGKLRKSLEAANISSRSYASYAAEEASVAEELHRQLAMGTGTSSSSTAAAQAATAMIGPPSAAAQDQDARGSLAGVGDRVQQQAASGQRQLLLSLCEELRSLRDERGRLLEPEPAVPPVRPAPCGDEQHLEEEVLTPRRRQAERRCGFLTSQVEALLRHIQQVEQLLDGLREDQAGKSLAPKTQRRLSVLELHKQATAQFGELDARLHTIEVQKADVERELERLLQRNAEQSQQLAATQQHRDELLKELASAYQARAPMKAPLALCEGGLQHMGTTRTLADATSSTRSGDGGFLGPAASSAAQSAGDDGGFLFGGGSDSRCPTVVARLLLEKQKRQEAREKEKTRAKAQDFLLESEGGARPRDSDRLRRQKSLGRTEKDRHHEKERHQQEARKSHKHRADEEHWQRERQRSTRREAHEPGAASGSHRPVSGLAAHARRHGEESRREKHRNS